MKHLVILLAVPLLSMSSAGAAPFRLTPESFKHWLNATQQTGWTKSDRIYFESINDCSFSEWNNSYRCPGSFVRISDPRGSRVCAATVNWVGTSYSSDGTPRFGDGAGVSNIRDCRWLKDPRFADN